MYKIWVTNISYQDIYKHWEEYLPDPIVYLYLPINDTLIEIIKKSKRDPIDYFSREIADQFKNFASGNWYSLPLLELMALLIDFIGQIHLDLDQKIKRESQKRLSEQKAVLLSTIVHEEDE